MRTLVFIYQTENISLSFLYADILAEKLPELKTRLQKAMELRDPDEISSALDAIDKRIPPEKLSQQDKALISKANDNLSRLEATQRMECFHLSSSTTNIRK